MEENLSCTGIVVEMCSPGHKAHLHHSKLQVILLLTFQPEALQCSRLITTSIPVAHATTWFHSSEVKHLLSHGKLANTAPAKGQTNGDIHAVLCRVNNGCPMCCAVKGEEKRIYRSLRQMRLLLMCFFACSLRKLSLK